MFCHLHCHTDYSLLDGAIKTSRLAARAAEFGMSACAITDHGAVYGLAEFHDACRKHDLEPVLGMEAYVTDDMREKGGPRYHLILLAENMEGYGNLLRLASLAATEGFYRKPRVDYRSLKMLSKGLISLSACIMGEVAQAVLAPGDMDPVEAALAAAKKYQEIFGEENFFLEIQHNGLEAQEKVNRALREASKLSGIPCVATNDCHFLGKDEYGAHEALLCVQTKRTLAQKDENGLHSLPELWFKDEAAMRPHFSESELSISGEIAARCHVELAKGKAAFPVYALPEGVDKEAEFERLCREGLEKRFADGDAPGERKPEYFERLEREIAVIENMGFPEYFLIVQEFINWAKDHGVPVGPGRGSAAGSIAAWAMRITNLDPMPYKLLFERFLNPERVSLPDIDVDFCERGREKAIMHMVAKYGKNKVAQVSTFGTMKAKQVVKDIGRVTGLSFAECNAMTSLMGDVKFLADALKDPAFAAKFAEHPELEMPCRALEGVVRQSGVHAAGLVVSPEPMENYSAVMDRKGSAGVPVTQYEAKWLEKFGLVKFDFLGLSTLTVIADTLENIRAMGKEPPNLDRLAPFEDDRVWELLSAGKTAGVFQLEGDGLTSCLVKLGPTCFEDLIAMLALYRPGPLGSGMVDSFIRRKHGEEEVSYFGLDEFLEPILAPTYGVIVYQEQVMQIAQAMAGYTLGGADLLRRAMGKKKAEEMARQHSIFVDGCVKNGISREKAEEVFGLMEKFAAYGFNKSHSAAYAQIAYQTAYLKLYWPSEFFAALLTSERKDMKKFALYTRRAWEECDVRVGLPGINTSRLDLAPSGDRAVSYGFMAIRGLKTATAEAIVKERDERGPFRSMKDFLERVADSRVSNSDVELLIRAGAMDEFKGTLSRRGLLAASLELLRRTRRKRKVPAEDNSLLAYMGIRDEYEGTPFGANPGDAAGMEEWPESKLLDLEQEAYGFYFSAHPLDRWAFRQGNSLKRLLLADELELGRLSDGWILLHISQAKRRTSKKGNPYCACMVEDSSYPKAMPALIWHDVLSRPQVAECLDDLAKTQGVCEARVDILKDKDGDGRRLVIKDLRPVAEPGFFRPRFVMDKDRGVRLRPDAMNGVRITDFDWKVIEDGVPYGFGAC